MAFLVDRDKIKDFMAKYVESGSKKPYKYTIDDNGRVSVTGSIKFTAAFNHTFTELPVEFKEVSQSFTISGASLKTLSGCPETVGGNFYCKYMAHLQDLTGGPLTVNGSYFCDDCENLRSLNGAPSHIPKMFSCTNTPLQSLIGGPSSCGSLLLSETQLINLQGAPAIVEDTVDCTDIPTLTSLDGCPDAMCLTLERCEQLHSLAGLGKVNRLVLQELAINDFSMVPPDTIVCVTGFNQLSAAQLKHCIENKIVVTFEIATPAAVAYTDYLGNGDFLELVKTLTALKSTKGLFKSRAPANLAELNFDTLNVRS